MLRPAKHLDYSEPGAVKATNGLFRAVASGGSPALVSRLSAQLFSHLLVGYGHAVLSPAESHPNLPTTHREDDTAALSRFAAAVPARLE